MHVETFFARNLGGLIHARPLAGPAREGISRTPSTHVDEKSDEATVPSVYRRGGPTPIGTLIC